MSDHALNAAFISVILIVVFFAMILVTPIMILVSRGAFTEGELFRELGEVVWVSMITSILSSTMSVMMCIPTAFYLSKIRLRVLRRLVFSILMVPALVSPSAVGSLLFLFFTVNPLGRHINAAIGIVNDLKGVIVAQFAVTLPLSFTYYLALFSSVPKVYEEVAMEAGLSSLGYLYKVLIPMTKNQVISGYTLSFARAFAEFGASLILGGAIRGKTWTLPIYVYAVTQLGGLTVLALVLLIYILIAIVVYSLLSTVGEVVGA